MFKNYPNQCPSLIGAQWSDKMAYTQYTVIYTQEIRRKYKQVAKSQQVNEPKRWQSTKANLGSMGDLWGGGG